MFMKPRFYELDLLRGIAIILMIFYHALYDLFYFADFELNLWSGVFWFIGRTSAFIFIFLVGVCMTISYSHAKKKNSKNGLFRKYLIRGSKIFLLGFLITAITYLFLPGGTIYFGILHFIGVSVVLGYLFLEFKRINLVFGAVVVAIGYYLKNLIFGFSSLLFLGFTPENFYTIDYFPLFPWFGVVLLGIFFGNTFYSGGERRFLITDYSSKLKALLFVGKNSLLIYLLHQPILIGLIYFLIV
ncbi:DUF1624 domain-containing protein [archaeon]|nr:DUF1624 domain-containing protein [archaeon]